MTGAGAPGGPGIIKALKKNKEISLHTADMNPYASGRFLSDYFHQIPPADNPNFLNHLVDICVKNNIKIIFPLVTKELLKLSKHKQTFAKKGIEVIVSDHDSLRISNDKGRLYSHLYSNKINLPRFKVVGNFDDLISGIYDLGYPNHPVVIKPCIGNGSRGIRVIDDKKNRFDMLFNEKPSSIYCRLSDIKDTLANREIPEMLISEFLPGEELTIDTIIQDKEPQLCLIRARNRMTEGISTSGTFIENKEVEEYIFQICKSLPGLSGPVGFQLKKSNKGSYLLLESNPRIQGTSIASLGLGINFPQLCIDSMIGKKIKAPSKLSGVSFARYYTEVFYDA